MPSTPPHATWTSTYQLSSQTRQQRILRAIQRLDHPAIKALGTTREAECVIVIECASAAAEVRSRQVVMALDVLAVRTETTRRREPEARPKRLRKLF
jgi:histone H3/H4